MKRFFDERLIAVTVAAAFALGTFNPDFALIRNGQASPAWLSALLVDDAPPNPIAPKRLSARGEPGARELAAR